MEHDRADTSDGIINNTTIVIGIIQLPLQIRFIVKMSRAVCNEQ